MQSTLSEVKLRHLASNLGKEWTALATYLGVRSDEVDRIKADYLGSEEQIFQMLMIWWQRWDHSNRSGDGGALSFLQESFVKIGRSDLAQSISDSMGPPSDWNFEVYRNEFIRYYKDAMGVVPLLPWLASEVSKINDMYVKLKYNEKDSKAGRVVKRYIGSYEDMLRLEFHDGQPVRFILLSGIAGSGKTTIVSKIATDWALQTPGSTLSKFSLLVALSMRELKRAPDLTEAVFDQILAKDTNVNPVALKDHLRSHAEEVLVVLDGADEFDKEGSQLPTEGDIIDIISNKVLRGCTVIVTTRPHMVDKLCKLNPCFTRIEACGFSEEGVKEYIEKFFQGEDPQIATDLYRYLVVSESLRNLAKIPMMLLLMCLVWSEGHKLHETLTELFTDAMFFILKRHFQTTDNLGISGDEDLFWNELKDTVKELGKAALDGLMLPGQKLVFDVSDFGNPAVVDQACKIGILSQERVRSKLRSVQCVTFIHKTFQEAIAGFYWATLAESNVDLFNHYLSLIPDDWLASTLEYVFRFCCGANTEAARLLLSHVVSSFNWDNSKSWRFHDFKKVGILDFDIAMRLHDDIKFCPQINLCFLMHLEAHGKELHSLMMPVFKRGLSFDLKCSKDVGLAFGFLIECASVSNPSFLTGLTKINVESIDKDGSAVVTRILKHAVIATDVDLEFDAASFKKNKGVDSSWQVSLGDALGSMQSLKTLSLYCRPFPVNMDLSVMFRCLAQTAVMKLECFALQGFKVDPSCLKQFLEQQDRLCQLGLSTRSLVHLENNDHFWSAVFAGLETQSLRVLEVSYSKHTGSQTIHLDRKYPNLEVLKLSEDGLQQEDLQQVVCVIPKAPRLQELDLSGNRIRDVFPSLVEQLPILNHLEVLNLNDTDLLSDQVVLLARDVLSTLPNLRVLSLSRSYHHYATSITPDALLSVVWWSCNSSSLEELDMKGCVATIPHRNKPQSGDESGEDLPTPTYSRPPGECSLKTLDVHRNYLGKLTPQFIRLLKHMPALKILNMNAMDLTDSDAIYLAEVLPSCPQLQELMLEGNDATLGKDGIEALYKAVQKLPNLKHLYLDVSV
ncbi:uncharacterized protein LOC119729288 [Patiria miniata]|uniref:NACHT domain-containing protein n=1 Tax=Patiria miniata TaxID=46514 RepID=A0A914A2K0_PATMI|nr:uncharacterized protein LOC119729288 [Patiria miniata]